MVELARRNATKMKASNVEFVLSQIHDLPLPDNAVDCVMSNCVLNLVADEHKANVFHEIYRILKPGGRLAISDFLALKPFTTEMKADPALKAGCVSGAIEVSEVKELLGTIGFDSRFLISIEDIS